MAPCKALRVVRSGLLVGFLVGLAGAPAWAQVPKEDRSGSLADREFFKPELALTSSHVEVTDEVAASLGRSAVQSFRQAPRGWSRIFVEPRSGVVTGLVGYEPIIPGRGKDNAVSLSGLSRALGRRVTGVDEAVVGDLVRRFFVNSQGLLGIDVSQLGDARVTQINPDLWQVSIPQVYQGIPVRYARVAATISHGNLVLAGGEGFCNVRGLDIRPKLSAEDALTQGFAFADGRFASDVLLGQPSLEILPVDPGTDKVGEAYVGEPGAGCGHRLVWSFRFQRESEGEAQWQVEVDAASGEVVSFQDANLYAERSVKGGVYPLTSTEICPNNQQCGVMQANQPMPWANTGFAAPNNFTDGAGTYDYTSGTATTTLSGRYIRISDTCGAISIGSSTGDINLGGSNGQHDCTSVGGSAGNTPASRSAFYELNKIAEQARGWLPNNTWLKNQLTANVNINSTCNAFWNGSSVNFYRSGGGCRNTGELAAVFDHEWGHGIDDNDANGSISNSGEGYADIAAIYRLQASCVGHGFFWTSNRGCGQTVDGTGMNQNEAQTGPAHCDTDCSGVRDSDWAKHADGQPDTALGFVCSSCSTGPGPCGRQVHCSAAPARQAAWDLVARDLRSAPFNLDSQTAFMIGNRLFYQGSGNIGTWHACTCGSSSSGCGATNGYMQWLAADDDNGNLNDGTPHMTAIFNAFNRHGIACSTPTAQNGGCAGGPTTAPTLTATPGNSSVSLSWNSVSGASRYWVLRTEGHAGCNFGKTRIADITGTSYTDNEVANGRAYSYNVVAVGSSSSCFTRVSTCQTVTPSTAPSPDFSVSCSPSSLSVAQGGSGGSTCTVSSTGGFNSAVSMSCANLPAGVTCGFSPGSVTPPANGSANSSLTVNVSASAATGTSTFQVRGASGSTTRSTNVNLTVTSTADFSVACSPSSLTVQQGNNGTSTCTVSSVGGFNSSVGMSCANLAAGVTCSFSPGSVTPPANGSANSTLTLSVSGSAAAGSSTFQVRGSSGSTTRSTNINLTVTQAPPPPGGGVVFFDDFETDKGWTRNPSGTDTATTGLWERGDPEPTSSGGSAMQLGDAFSGTNNLVTGRPAGSSVGSDDIDNGVTSIRSPAITLPSSGSLKLSFVYYLAHLSNATTDDFLRVKVVGSTTVTVFEELGSGDVDAAAWANASVDISAFAGQTVRIQIEAADAGSGSLIEAGVDDVSIETESVVFEDDFETDKGWTRNPSGTDTATTGLWERGDPEPTSSGGSAMQLGDAFSGTNNLVTGRIAGTSVGTDDIDNGVTSIRSPAISLPSSGTIQLSFVYYMAHLNNATADDFLRVKVVGSTTVTVFEELGSGDTDAAVWEAATVDISSFAGQTVRILIEAADAGSGSLIEAGIDDVKVTR